MARVTLTKGNLATKAGADLLDLLKRITADGEISLGEVDMLRDWLRANTGSSGVYAVDWLRELVELVLRDGKITKDERLELLLAIERVLPAGDRLLAKKRRDIAEAQTAHDQDVDDDAGPATDRQIDYLSALGVRTSEQMTKSHASVLIDRTLSTRGDVAVTNRQMMVLRFWNKVGDAARGRSGVSVWMDEWMTQDHWDAWTLWKSENVDDGRQGDPTLVPVGIGEEYLRRVAVDSATGTALSAADSLGYDPWEKGHTRTTSESPSLSTRSSATRSILRSVIEVVGVVLVVLAAIWLLI